MNPALKIVRLLISLVALPAVAVAVDAAKNPTATTSNQENAPEWAGLFGGAALPVAWQSAVAASEKIDAALAAKKLEGVAEWAETIHLAAHALDDQVKLEDAGRAKRLGGALRQAARIADDVLDAAQHNEVDHAADAHRRLKSALSVVKLRLPREILDAPPQELRFAKK